MPLILSYHVNEGIRGDEVLDSGEKRSFEIIVREITSSQGGVEVDIELRDLNGETGSYNLRLSEDQRYDVTHRCTLHVPKNPFRSLGELNQRRVCLVMYAPRCVEFSQRRMHPSLME